MDRRCIAVLLLASLVAAPAEAYTGRYLGPTGDVPHDLRGPGDPPPPDTGGCGPCPADTGPGAVAYGRGSRAGAAPGYDSWRFEWHYRKERILAARGTARSEEAMARGDAQPPGPDPEVAARVRALAANRENNWLLQGAALIATARLQGEDAVAWLLAFDAERGDILHSRVEACRHLALGLAGPGHPLVRSELRRIVSDPHRRSAPRGAAVLALSTSPDAWNVESSILRPMLDGPAVGSSAHPVRHRRGEESLALAGLGISGTAENIPWIRSAIETALRLRRESNSDPGSREGLLSAGIAATGLIAARSDDGTRIGALEYLESLARGNTMPVRRAVARAAGEMCARAGGETRDRCLAFLQSEFRRESGQAGDPDVAAAVLHGMGAALETTPPDRGTAEAEVRAFETLIAVLAGNSPLRNHAALALGRAARGLSLRQRDRAVALLAEIVSRPGGSLESRGALHLALGLLGGEAATVALREFPTEDGRRPETGNVLLARALAGDRSVLEPVVAALGNRWNRECHMDAATAAGILGQGAAVPVLLDRLRDPKSSAAVLGAVAIALGRIADPAFVAPLLEIAESSNDEFQDLTRATAVAAVGLMAPAENPPPWVEISGSCEFRSWVYEVGELLDIL